VFEQKSINGFEHRILNIIYSRIKNSKGSAKSGNINDAQPKYALAFKMLMIEEIGKFQTSMINFQALNSKLLDSYVCYLEFIRACVSVKQRIQQPMRRVRRDRIEGQLGY
jgi:hypothetical protein